MLLSREIFWDCKADSIDFETRARFVIQRVLQYGKLADWNEVQRFYGLEKIKEEMLKEPDLDPRTLAFLSVILDVPKENFQCYKKKQSPQAPWIY